MTKRKNKFQFIQEAKCIHDDKYDYSEVIYINAYTKVKIWCKKCKEYFYQTPKAHLSNKNGCANCSKNKKLTIKTFIQKAKKIHGDKYSYDQAFFIKNAHDKIKIYCKSCKKYFYQTVDKHLNGHNCPECMQLVRKKAKSTRSNTEDFINKAKQMWFNRFDYTKVNYKNNKTKIIIKCNKCNKEFTQTPSSHLNGTGCPYCNNSKGENKIINWLETNKINYEYQYRFIDCRDKWPLPFDFYLPDYDLCIEFQGQQHYNILFYVNILKDKKNAKSKFNLVKKHDKIKKEYCKKNNIMLLEIKYNENIEERLEIFLKNLNKQLNSI